eukprot:6523328-Prymnesium_polylepis.3
MSSTFCTIVSEATGGALPPLATSAEDGIEAAAAASVAARPQRMAFRFWILHPSFPEAVSTFALHPPRVHAPQGQGQLLSAQPTTTAVFCDLARGRSDPSECSGEDAPGAASLIISDATEEVLGAPMEGKRAKLGNCPKEGPWPCIRVASSFLSTSTSPTRPNWLRRNCMHTQPIFKGAHRPNTHGCSTVWFWASDTPAAVTSTCCARCPS